MKHWIFSAVFLASLASATPATAPPGTHACERANHALLLAAQHQSQADFWSRVAECLGDPEGNMGNGIKNAYLEWREADALALQIFNARETACALFGHVPYEPQIIASQFGTVITNPYVQVSPGKTLIRERHSPAGLERIETSMSNEVKIIGGVSCRSIREREVLDGVLVEDTYNWIAQHQAGAVWNFGELDMSFDNGVLDSLDGSWRYGTDGVKPGIHAPQSPALGDVYHQEFWLGRAEGISRVIRLDETVSVPAGVFDHCLVIEDWDPLEPFEFILSFIAPNIGVVLEVDEHTGERSELVEIHA